MAFKSGFVAGTLVAAALAFASPASAGIVNVSFETGNTSGWTSTMGAGGSISVNGADVNPGAGSFSASLIAGAQNVYTTLSQSFFLTAGDVLSFAVKFIAHDYLPFNDNARVLLTNFEGGTITTLFASSVSAVGDFGNSGWVTVNYVAPDTGTYSLNAGVRNIGDSANDSELRLDGIASAVPEASTWAMLVLGFLGVGFLGYRRSRSVRFA